jgi:glucose/arabinose dehydrogenase
MKPRAPASLPAIVLAGSLPLLSFLALGLVGACGSGDKAAGTPDAGLGASRDGSTGFADTSTLDGKLPPDLDAKPPMGAFCALPGSVVYTAQGPQLVEGAAVTTPSLAWLDLPVGYCAHYFGYAPTARQLRFAPDGRLFVASPTAATTGGAGNGVAGIVILPDADGDGVADESITYLGQLPSTQGLMFHDGYLYFQDGVTVQRVPFQAGDIAPSGSVEAMMTVNAQQAPEHWPKVLDIAQDGTMYVTNGSTQTETCLSTRPVFGAIFKVSPDGGQTEVARGFRNPIALRCEPDHDVCIALELALDYSDSTGPIGREKLLPVHQGDDWGFPCCATHDLAYPGVIYADTDQAPDCTGVGVETDAFVIGDTPFGIDFETGKWPAPWGGRAFVTLHGVYGTWQGARIVAIARDPGTGMPLTATDVNGGESANTNMMDFAVGWDDGRQDHGRPAPVTFAPDGRLFVGDDQLGAVIWIAPVGLMMP